MVRRCRVPGVAEPAAASRDSFTRSGEQPLATGAPETAMAGAEAVIRCLRSSLSINGIETAEPIG